MKKTKRNIAIIVVLLFVCAAIYFNWSYNTQWGKADAEMAAAEDGASSHATRRCRCSSRRRRPRVLHRQRSTAP